MLLLPCRHPASALALRLQNLPAIIHAGLRIDVMRTAQFTRILVLDVVGLLERIGRAAHAAAGWRGFPFRYGHETNLPDHDGFRSKRPKITNVIDSHSLEHDVVRKPLH